MKHLLKNYVTVIEFARLNDVYPQTVYNDIENKKIKTTLVGKAQSILINVDANRNYKPKKRKLDVGKLRAWYKKTYNAQY